VALAGQRRFGIWATHQLLWRSKLVLGWDRGEWGGQLLAGDLSSAVGRWEPLRAGPDFTDSYLAVSPISGLVVSRKRLWIATGLGHMAGRSAGLFTYDEGTWRTLIKQSNFDKRGHTLPKEAVIEGVATGEQDAVFVLTTLGIYRVDGKAPHREVGFELEALYPTSLVIDAYRRFYVGTFDAGVFVIEKTKAG
jgi:hypothetical protein